MTGGLIDFHAHFVTGDYVSAAQEAGIVHPDGMPDWPSWNVFEQLETMDRRSIDRAVLSISSPGVAFGPDPLALAREVNDVAADHVARHPDRFAFFGSLPLPDVDSAVVEAMRALDELGARGVIVESNAHGQYLGDASLEPLWRVLDDRNAILFMHPTSPPAFEQTSIGRPRPMLEFMFDSTRTITDLLLAGVTTRHPGMRVLVPHAGAALPLLSDRIALFQTLFAANGGAPGTPWHEAFAALWFDMAGTPFPTQIPVLASKVGTERIVYGSDSCWTLGPGVDAQLASIRQASPPDLEADWESLTTANARRLLG